MGRYRDRLANDRRFAVAILATLVFLSTLGASLILQGKRWEVIYEPPTTHNVLWDPGTSAVFASNAYAVGQYQRAGDHLEPLGWVRTNIYESGHSGGPMARRGDWLFFARDDGFLYLLNAADWPTDGGYHNVTDLDHRGSVTMFWAFNFRPGVTWWIEDMGFSGDSLLIAGSDDRSGRILALDMNDPLSVTEDPASLQVLYNVRFGGPVLDILVVDQTLYVLERVGSGSTLHLLDLSVQPPTEQFAFPMEWSWRFDVQGNLVAASTNTTVSFYRIVGGSMERAASISLPDSAGGVKLAGSWAYARWGNRDTGRVGLSIFDISDPAAPRELWRFELDKERAQVATDLAVGGDAAYLPGYSNLVMMLYATRAALLTSVPLEIALTALGVTATLAFIRSRTAQRSNEHAGSR